MMAIDAALLWGITEKLVIAAAGGLATYLFGKRTRLVVYFGHVAVFKVTLAQQQQVTVHTHSLVLRNGGGLPATNVRIPHRVAILPGGNLHLSVEPNLAHSVSILPGGGTELKFDVLVPKQQVTVSYLYYPPLVVSHIHDPISCDQMMAKGINVLPTYQFPRWASLIALVLIFIGAVATVYMIIMIAEGVWPLLNQVMFGRGKSA